MPKKIEYGPATRKSQRQATATEQGSPAEDRPASSNESDDEVSVAPGSPEPDKPATPQEASTDPELNEPVTSTKRPEQDKPARPQEEVSANQKSIEPLQSIERDESEYYDPAPEDLVVKDNMLQSNDQQDMQAQLAAALSRITQLESNARLTPPARDERGITPDNSAFGGSNFKPTGFAALEAFKPYGTSQKALNPAYDKRARQTGIDPGNFDGDEEEFDKWIIKLADKMEQDDETFKNERSRMAVLNSLTKGAANDVIAGRYQSTENPFRNIAEMVAVLTSVYHDDNQGSKAREELRKIRYKPGGKDLNIHQFIAKINSLVDKAGIAKEDRKTILYEHIPADLDTRLLRDSKNPSMSYEDFSLAVADAAEAHQRSYEQRRENRHARRARSPATHSDIGKERRHSNDRRDKASSKKEPELDAKSGEAKKEELKKDGLCFVCHKEGHQARHCPDRKAVLANILALDQDEKDDGPSSDSSSLSSLESKN